MRCLLDPAADRKECERSRRRLHAQHNVSRHTTCVGVRDACVVGERIVLGPGRAVEAQQLAALFEPLVRDYVWAMQTARITARGTFSAIDAQPGRYCSYNATISGVGAAAKCIGDNDEGDGIPRWRSIDPSATASAVWRADRRRFGLVFWPIYAAGFSEAFGNNALPLHQLHIARWLPPDGELLPASSWHDYWFQPFTGGGALQTLQRLELRRETRCYRQLAVCQLASFVFDRTFHSDSHWRPWDAMQHVVAHTPALRAEALRMASTWRRPQLRLVAAAAAAANSAAVGTGQGSGASDGALRVVIIKRPGRRKLANAAQLARSFNGTSLLGVPLATSLHTFGGMGGLVHDARVMRGTDVLIGPHGADLLNGLCMHAGASLVEARGHLFTRALGVWVSWYEDFYAFDHVVHHYAYELGLNETLGAARLQARLGRPLSPHDTWNLNMELPPRKLRHALEAIIDVNGQPSRYLERRARAQHGGIARRRQQQHAAPADASRWAARRSGSRSSHSGSTPPNFDE